MPLNITFDAEVGTGGSIWNKAEYPPLLLEQSLPPTKIMGAHVDPNDATVDVSGAQHDLEAQNYSLRHTFKRDTIDSSNVWSLAGGLESNLNGLIKGYFEENITVHDGTNTMNQMIQFAVNNISPVDAVDAWWGRISQSSSGGKYYSYQLTFYSRTKASYCFLVISITAFGGIAQSPFDRMLYGTIPTPATSGIAYNIQLFEIWKTDLNPLYGPFRVTGPRTLQADGAVSTGTRFLSDGTLVVNGATVYQGAGKDGYTLKLSMNAELSILDDNDVQVWTAGFRFTQSPAYFTLEMLKDALVLYTMSDDIAWKVIPDPLSPTGYSVVSEMDPSYYA